MYLNCIKMFIRDSMSCLPMTSAFVLYIHFCVSVSCSPNTAGSADCLYCRYVSHGMKSWMNLNTGYSMKSWMNMNTGYKTGNIVVLRMYKSLLLGVSKVKTTVVECQYGIQLNYLQINKVSYW